MIGECGNMLRQGDVPELLQFRHKDMERRQKRRLHGGTIYKSDKEEYVGNIVFRQALVVISRIMNHYKNNLMLPEKTSSWWSGFLGSTSNCPVHDPLSSVHH